MPMRTCDSTYQESFQPPSLSFRSSYLRRSRSRTLCSLIIIPLFITIAAEKDSHLHQQRWTKSSRSGRPTSFPSSRRQKASILSPVVKIGCRPTIAMVTAQTVRPSVVRAVRWRPTPPYLLGHVLLHHQYTRQDRRSTASPLPLHLSISHQAPPAPKLRRHHP